MKNKVILALLILICFLLQCTVLHLFAIGSITPNLLLILCVSIGLMKGKTRGMWVGFFSGLLIDLFYSSLFGFYALIYMYLGYLSGYACKIYYDDDVKVAVLLVTAADFFYGIAVYILQFLLRGRMGFWTYLYRIILPEIFYTAFLTLMVYKIFYYINYHFMNIIRKESESIWVLK